MTAEAEFYKHLQHLWEVVSREQGDYASPCVDVGLAYINSVSSRGRRDYIRKEVYKLLDKSYHGYLYTLEKQVHWYLSWHGMDAERDKSICLFFVKNHRWLKYDEKACDWYGATSFEPSRKDKSSGRNKFLVEERNACERRLAAEKAAEEKRFLKFREEGLQAIIREQKIRGFWRGMADVSG
ncbi:MAG: hypothetical protein ABSB00_02230 [Minisyncoccia bacterium]|jgi:hypothetical protein